jgi:hypothetical protein
MYSSISQLLRLNAKIVKGKFFVSVPLHGKIIATAKARYKDATQNRRSVYDFIMQKTK